MMDFMDTVKKPQLDWENETVFKDTVLGYINVPKAMARYLIDHEIFQRLQDVAQTGMETLYPGATHNRFCHSIGVYHLAKMAFRCFQQNVQRQHGEEIYTKVADSRASCERVWNRWRFLFESAALLHDCGHSPLSHSLEFLYDVGRSTQDAACLTKRCDEMLWGMFEGSPNFQDNFYSKGDEDGEDDQKRQLKNAYGAPHERMSAYLLIHPNGYRPALGTLIHDQLTYFDITHPELEGSAPDYGEAELFSDLEFMVRAIIGCPYDENSHFWGEEENHREIVYQLRNCVISLLHGTIDVDNIDYSIRDATSSGYKSAQVDYERLLKAETIALSFDHREKGLELRGEPFDHSLLLSSFVSEKITDETLDLSISGSATILVEWDGGKKDAQAGFRVIGTMAEDDETSGEKENQRVLHLKPGSSAHLQLKSGTLKITPRDADKNKGTQVYIRSKCLRGVIHGIIFTGNHSPKAPSGGKDLDAKIRQGKLRISSAFHKSALSVIQGALDATNFESRWIYSHHVTTYNNNFLSVFLLEMCADYYFEKDYSNLLNRLGQILEFYPRYLHETVPPVPAGIVEHQLSGTKKILQSVCRNLENQMKDQRGERVKDWLDEYPDLKNPELPQTLPNFSLNSNLEMYSLLLDAACKLGRPMPPIDNAIYGRLQGRLFATLAEIVRALRRLPTELPKGKPLQPWELEAFHADRRWVNNYNGYTMGMETMKAMLGMPDRNIVNGQSFYHTSDSNLRSMYHSLAQNASSEDKENYRDLMDAIRQSESRRYLKTMWKSHAEFHFYIQGWKQSWLERPEHGDSLVQRLFYGPDTPCSPKDGDILYMYFSDYSIKRYDGRLNQLWDDIKKTFHLDILVYVPQKIRHKTLEGNTTYIVWKNRIVTLSDLGLQASEAPSTQYFYLYYHLAENGEAGEARQELDVCDFMDFLEERLTQLENSSSPDDAYGDSNDPEKGRSGTEPTGNLDQNSSDHAQR